MRLDGVEERNVHISLSNWNLLKSSKECAKLKKILELFKASAILNLIHNSRVYEASLSPSLSCCDAASD